MSDEFLAEAVRKYPIIYDKKKKGHKDKMMVENAWQKVAEEVGLESSEIAKRLFDNLKKKFHRRRRQAAGPSGCSAESVAEPKARLKELAFLSWLEPHVQARQTKSNCPNTFKEYTQTEFDDSSENESCDSTNASPQTYEGKENTESAEESSVVDTQKGMLFELQKSSVPLKTNKKRSSIRCTIFDPEIFPVAKIFFVASFSSFAFVGWKSDIRWLRITWFFHAYCVYLNPPCSNLFRVWDGKVASVKISRHPGHSGHPVHSRHLGHHEYHMSWMSWMSWNLRTSCTHDKMFSRHSRHSGHSLKTFRTLKTLVSTSL